MYLDTPTMIFSFATGSLIMAVGLFIANLRAAHMRVMTLWVAANFLIFAAWVLYGAFGETAQAIVGVVAFALFVGGYGLEFSALSLFCGRRISPRLLAGLIVAGVAANILTVVADPGETRWRILCGSLVISAWFAASAVTLILGPRREERTSRLMTAGFFVALAIAYGLRAVFANGVQSLVLAVNYVGLFGTSLGFILMTKERADSELIRTASMDSLTSLLNRRSFIESAERELHRADRQQLQTSVLMLDLDHFKEVNDTYGHPVGDLVLASFARVLRSTLRPFDVVGRYGGEEFCVLLPGTGIDEAVSIAERIRLVAGNTLVETRASTVAYAVSTGVVEARASDTSLSDLVDRADRALYQAKAGGRNCVRSG
ncbi:MAG: diguanylate cyclase [Candidatus Aquilonibacter sp.]